MRYINPVKSVSQLTTFEDRYLPAWGEMGWDRTVGKEGGPHYVYVVGAYMPARLAPNGASNKS